MLQKKVIASVETIVPLTDTVLQISLLPETYVDYKPGQYLQIICQDEAVSYSIANAPLGAHKYEIHIRHSPDNPGNQALLKEIKTKGKLTLNLPFGDCSLDKLAFNKPIVFVAGGTGFAPVKAMIEQILADSDARAFTLFWLARTKSDLYLDTMVNIWQSQVKQCAYFPLLSSNHQEKTLSEKLKMMFSIEDLMHKQWVVSGPFDMVYSIRDALLAKGISQDCIFSDAFSFEQPK